MDFHKLKTAVESNFKKLAASGNLYVTDVGKDDDALSNKSVDELKAMLETV